MDALYERAAREIDTSWRHSEHWPKTEFGSMTEEGWKRALRDCRSEAEYAEVRAGRLRALEKVLTARVGGKWRQAKTKRAAAFGKLQQGLVRGLTAGEILQVVDGLGLFPELKEGANDDDAKG